MRKRKVIVLAGGDMVWAEPAELGFRHLVLRMTTCSVIVLVAGTWYLVGRHLSVRYAKT
jgi:hypothetical protein